MSFGPGDVSANDWGFSGSGTKWTNWGTTVIPTGGLTRVTALAVRWGAYDSVHQSSGTTTGHNDLWASGNSLVASTGNFGVSAPNAGAFNNSGISPNVWLPSGNFFGGMWRTSTQTSTTPFKDGSGGSYSGKDADDATNSGGTANWAGVGSPGGMGWTATSTNCKIFVRRSGVWTACEVFIWHSGAYGSQIQLFIDKSGSWTVLNYLNLTREAIPENGLPIRISYGRTSEPALLIEEGFGWFGTIDPTTLGIDWTKTGSFVNVPYPAPFTGRYNSRETPEVVDDRMYAHDQWKRALARGDEMTATHWLNALQPGRPSSRPITNTFIAIGGVR